MDMSTLTSSQPKVASQHQHSQKKQHKIFFFFFIVLVLLPCFTCDSNASSSKRSNLLDSRRKQEEQISKGTTNIHHNNTSSTTATTGVAQHDAGQPAAFGSNIVGYQGVHEEDTDAGQDLSFLVMSDVHMFTPFSFARNQKWHQVWDDAKEVLSYIKEQYGGELIMLPGDSVSYGGMPNDDIRGKMNAPMDMSINEVVYTAAYNCYTTVRQLFSAVGYDTILAAVGDHELGGNKGFRTGKRVSKISTIPSYRKAVADGYNKDADMKFLYREEIGAAKSRPMGTVFEETSYAYRYKNSLFISIDAFKEAIDNQTDYIDRVNGLGGEGTITCDVDGAHLDWFENVLVEARKDETIRHIFVQAHVPILQPVRKVKTSGQFMDGAEKSKFWKIMNQYGVDIYFAGDVHSSTASISKDPKSTVVQIISRGNPFNHFLHIYTNYTVIDVTLYNEVGPKGKLNTNYTEYGRLTIDKSSPTNVNIESMGELELVDPESELIRFDFEEIVPLGTRQVFALNDNNNLMLSSVVIWGVVCTDSMLNTGTLGSQYDAQVGKLRIAKHPKRLQGGNAAHFRRKSRFAIYGMGPFSGGEIVSFSIWIKPATKLAKQKEMVLFHYANAAGPSSGIKNHLTLTIARGVPKLYFSPSLQFEAVGINVVRDREWHQIAVSMPSKSCRASKVQLFVDGKLVETRSTTGNDEHLFFHTDGRMSIGGLGYNSEKFSKYYPKMGSYRGWMDDFRLKAT